MLRECELGHRLECPLDHGQIWVQVNRMDSALEGAHVAGDSRFLEWDSPIRDQVVCKPAQVGKECVVDEVSSRM